MKIIRITQNKNGSYPALQEWTNEYLPNGYAWCPDEFVNIFYSIKPCGFVNIIIKDNVVTDMTINESALNEYLATVPNTINDKKQDDTKTIYERIKALEESNTELNKALSMILEGTVE